MGRLIPPSCPECGAGGTDGHRHNVVIRLYERSGAGQGPFVGVGWKCPNGHLFTDTEVATTMLRTIPRGDNDAGRT